jgi:hypothetical protein
MKLSLADFAYFAFLNMSILIFLREWILFINTLLATLFGAKLAYILFSVFGQKLMTAKTWYI